MAEVRIEHVFKRFGAVTAVNDFDLVVKDGEFVSILGPSGCGKTTTLRMIAGFERATEGEIYIGDHCVSSSVKGSFAPPEKRDIGMVFQSYAVWPHMTVAENVGYPLKIQKVDKKEREERVQKMLELVHLGEYSKRYPHQLSGGQQQRVALARALVAQPGLLLLDEPLSNLDAKLRESMRFEILAIQKELGITVVYVTHDQGEAMAMSDRVVVMSAALYSKSAHRTKFIPSLPTKWLRTSSVWLTLLMARLRVTEYLLRAAMFPSRIPLRLPGVLPLLYVRRILPCPSAAAWLKVR